MADLRGSCKLMSCSSCSRPSSYHLISASHFDSLKSSSFLSINLALSSGNSQLRISCLRSKGSIFYFCTCSRSSTLWIASLTHARCPRLPLLSILSYSSFFFSSSCSVYAASLFSSSARNSMFLIWLSASLIFSFKSLLSYLLSFSAFSSWQISFSCF